MDQLFDMCIHHGGVFITHSDTYVEYVRGTESRVSDVDIDTLAVFDMPKNAKNLGITNVKEFLYQIPQMELHNGLCSLNKDGDVRALRDWLEFAPEKLIHIYVKHVEQAFEEQVDEDQGNEGDDEHECYKEVDEGVGVDDNFFDEDYADLVGDSEFDRYEKPSSPNNPYSHIVSSTPHDQSNLNPYEKKTSNWAPTCFSDEEHDIRSGESDYGHSDVLCTPVNSEDDEEHPKYTEFRAEVDMSDPVF
nr:hypothetical protein CFP56_28297 [Quercus suber]